MTGDATSPDQRARFVTNLQHLLTDGVFVSTYKYALLLALTRWAVENPDHDETLPLDVGALAEHFTLLYWPHVRPFRERLRGVADRPEGHVDWDAMLAQDRGLQRPRVLKLVLAAQQEGFVRLHDMPAARRRRLLADVRESIRDMPLWKLHEVGDRDEFRFLYRRGRSASQLSFEPGVVGCLAAFAPLIEHVVRSAWLRFVLGYNRDLLGTAAQVEQFLFPEARNDLAVWRPALVAVQGDECFYCGGAMRNDVAVDHFLPWSRYPRDLGHNFVLAHGRCNAHKRDHLASVEHLARWCERNERQGDLLSDAFDRSQLPHDWPVLKRAAGTLYVIAANVQARVWRRGRELTALADGWRPLLGVG